MKKATPEWSSLKTRLATMKDAGTLLTMSDVTSTAQGSSFMADVQGGVLVGVDPPTPRYNAITTSSSTPTFTLANPPTLYTEEDLNKVREQEKSKLYGRIDDLKLTLDQLKAKDDAREAEILRQTEDAAKIDKEKRESDTDLRELLQQKDAEWQARLESIQAEAQRSQALLVREQEMARVSNYRAERVAAEQENIAPELIDMVSGSTPEEIDASIALLAQKTQSIIGAMHTAQAQARRDMPGARITAPGTGPLETQTSEQSFTAEQISAMSMADYVKNRSRLLGPQAQARTKGMFG